MLLQIIVLLFCQLAGDLLVNVAELPVPGPVIGLFLLFILLLVKRRVPAALEQVSTGLLTHMSLFFVPAGAGVVLHLALIGEEWPAIVSALLISTVAAIVVTALVMHRLAPEH